jgi:hypothetical protein
MKSFRVLLTQSENNQMGKGFEAKRIEVRLTTGTRRQLRERAHCVRDLRDLFNVSAGLGSEMKRNFLEDAELFSAEEPDFLSKMTDKELHQFLTRLENLLTIEQKRAS